MKVLVLDGVEEEGLEALKREPDIEAVSYTHLPAPGVGIKEKNMGFFIHCESPLRGLSK